MPTYLARGVSARLGTMLLADTISPEIILRKGDMARQQVETTERLMRGSKLLQEVTVPFPGDENQHPLIWLGNAPFIQVQARWNVSGSNTSSAQTGMSSDPTGSIRTNMYLIEIPTAQAVNALILHVNLSERTYVSGLCDKKTPLKIEIFFNGQLSHCWFMSMHDVKSGVRGHHQIFAGTRVGFLAERPWVILPPGISPDGSFETNHEPVSVLQRWHDICQALQSEASERGVNKEGEAPPTAKFLQALATMQVPDQVHTMQKPSGKVFGAIDVIITAGEGRKLTSGVSYLKAPKRMTDENFSYVVQRDSVTAELLTPHKNQNGSSFKLRSLEPGQGLFDINSEAYRHQEHSCNSEHCAPVSSTFSKKDQTCTHSSPQLAQLISQGQILYDVQHMQASEAHHNIVTPNGSRWNVFHTAPTSQVHFSPSTPAPSTPQGASTLDGSYSRISHSNSLHSFAINGHDPNHASSMLSVGEITVHPKQTGPIVLPTHYLPSDESSHEFRNARFSSPKESLLSPAGQYSGNTQYSALAPDSVPNSLRQVNHETLGWSFLPAPFSDGQFTSWHLPPVGLYSVPRKPNRSTSLRKNPIPARAVDTIHGPVSIPVRVPDSSCGEGTQPEFDHARGAWPSRTRTLSIGASQSQLDSTPSSQSSTCNKRKTSRRVAVNKSGCSPDMKTDNNPPLNHACVIAYAESNDKDNKQGVLRQVRCERVGVFQEDYVVFATRFFVTE